jgi:hypothetical protein
MLCIDYLYHAKYRWHECNAGSKLGPAVPLMLSLPSHDIGFEWQRPRWEGYQQPDLDWGRHRPRRCQVSVRHAGTVHADRMAGLAKLLFRGLGPLYIGK